MMTSIQGVYRGGKVELAKPADSINNGTPVIVTFLTNGAVDLGTLGVTPEQAGELRQRLASFADEGSSPEMAAYDNYHAARSKE